MAKFHIHAFKFITTISPQEKHALSKKLRGYSNYSVFTRLWVSSNLNIDYIHMIIYNIICCLHLTKSPYIL